MSAPLTAEQIARLLGSAPPKPAPKRLTTGVLLNPPLPDRFRPVILLALALAAGIMLAALAHYLDPVVRERRDLEQTGLPVLAAIPRR